MASVVLQQNIPGFSEVGTTRAILAADSVNCRSIVADGPVLVSNDTSPGTVALTVHNTSALSAGVPPLGGTITTLFQQSLGAYTGGGIAANTLYSGLVCDPTVATGPAVGLGAFGVSYPNPIGGTAPATSCVAITRVNACVPLNYAAPFVGQITGTGAAQIVACAGIPTSSQVRFMLVGGSIAAFAAGVAAPTALSIQGNVSFTITLTSGAIYEYEVLFA
jgi:hypothetical protein